MRRLASTALLALLGACTVTTTGAPCASDLECPSDQGCGSDGTCGTAALACPGHTTGGECSPGTTCLADQLLTCTAGNGVCSTGPVAEDCPAHQACRATGSSASCECATTRCGATTSSFCSPEGQVVTCAQESSGKGCWYEAASAACGDPGTSCVEAAGATACACPVANACATLDAARCATSGGRVEVCAPVATGSSCLTWQSGTDCTAGGLVCSGGACACPDNPGPTFVADAQGGSPVGSAPGPTGLDSPAACRFRSLGPALAAAGRRGPGSTVRAVGWSSAVPGGSVVFSEAGAIAVGPGVTLTTDDATPNPSHYAVTTGAALGSAFVTLGPGSAIAGFEVRNSASTGPGIETSCPDPADTASVSLSSVAISSSAAGPPVVRFSSGLRASGSCPVSMSGGTVSGATTGILAEADAPTTLSGGSVTGNGTGVSIGAAGAAAPSFSATGTSFGANAGDAVYVARGTFASDACPYADNGTHVHAQPVGGATVSVTVQNSTGAAKMTGATNSALRLLAMGSGSTLVLAGNEVVGNTASQDYNVSSGLRRGGGVVLTPPLPGSSVVHSTVFAGNKFDQVLVAASTGALDLSGGNSCGPLANTFACYDGGAGVGLYANGALVAVPWNRWTQQPGALGIDVGGTGVTGYDTSACAPATISCP
jgi:hypothetical protein